MAFIWRIEDKKGVGMYWKIDASTLDRKFFEDILRRKKCRPSFDPHPSADEDGGLSEFWENLRNIGERDVWHFGYITLAQARKWVGSLEMCQYMEEQGLHLVKYHMDREAYQAGNFQAIFNRRVSQRTETRKLSTLFS